MMKNLTTLILVIFLAVSCNNGNRSENQAQKSEAEIESMEKIAGEWAVVNDWSDSILIFDNKTDNSFEQKKFPSYNTIVFNQKNKTIEVNTYGEFGCGMAALENLEITNSKWNFENGLLKLTFDYSDYSGKHKLKNLYKVERKEQQLVLTRMQ